MSVAARSQRDSIRGMLADLKMPGSLEAVDGILSEIDGDTVEVRLVEVAPVAGALRFELLSEGRTTPPRGRPKGPPRGRAGKPGRRRA